MSALEGNSEFYLPESLNVSRDEVAVFKKTFIQYLNFISKSKTFYTAKRV